MNTLATSFCVLLLQLNAFAWSGAGHQVIAAEAYLELSPALKIKVMEILKAHSDYQKWAASFTSGSPHLDLATFIFMRSSTWPDEIRRLGNKYDHPKWHYVDHPLKPPSFPIEPGPDPTDDIQQCEKTFADEKSPPEERAVYLTWLIHLIGDLHRPLHCCSSANEVYSAGDRGGNSLYVKPAKWSSFSA